MSFLKRKAARTAIAFVAMAGAVAGGMAAWWDVEPDEVIVKAMFTDASPLIPGNLIRMNGIEVGEIENVTLENGRAAVDMRLDPEVLPLYDNASAKIRPVTLLGERFIDLDRGSGENAARREPHVIPVERTSSAADLDEVLNSLDDPTSTALAALVTTLGEGVGGQGPEVDEAIRALAPAMRNTQDLAGILRQQNELLNQLIDNAVPAAEAVAGKDGKNLDRMVGQAKGLLEAVAAQRTAMKDALVRLPGTLRNAQQVLSEVAGVAEAGTDTLRSARPVTDDLVQITDELKAFADSAKPALASLPPVLKKAKSLLDQAAPLVRDLDAAGRALPGISAAGNKLVGDLTPALSTALDFMKYWAMSTNGQDALGNYFRAFVVTTPKSLLQIPGTGLGPQKPGEQPPAQPPPAPSQSDADQSPDQEPPGVGLPRLPLPSVGEGGSATGLDEKQENALLGQLLGGLR